MGASMTDDERRAFKEISYAIGDGNPHPIEDIKGVAVPKQKIQEYMSLFVRLNLFNRDGELYIIAGDGKDMFKQKRESDSRNAETKKQTY